MNALKGEETIFAEALRRPPEERAAYLAQATHGNAELLRRVESLLGSYHAGDFLEQAAAPQLHQTLPVTVPLTEKPGDTIGRYKLLQQIGEGGCGVVYMAEQTEPVRRRVALKIIKLGMDTKSVIARFEAERQALAMMDHSNIAKVFDAGATEAGRPYFVMELVRGMKITEYCDEAKLSTRARLDLFIQVCQAIQHAHQKGIIHRDIKPSNILVTVNDGVPVPKVIDFGIAKATSGQQLTDKTLFTAFEQFIGTPAYMSPEQAVLTSLDIDTRSDIYALGVLLYELLTGKTPFDAKELLAIGLDEMRRTIREQEPPRPSTRLSTLPGQELSTTAQRRGLEAPKLVSELRGDLDWIVMKALEKDRARRYETANGLAMDIQRHLSNEPIIACPPSRLYRVQKAVRRNKLAFTAAGVVAIVLVLGVIVSAWQAQRAKAERDSVEAVLRFVRENILAAGRPEGWGGGLGKDVTLRKAIDAAEPQIAAIFQHRPLVEAAIRESIGQSYSYLGEPALAIQQKERVLALRRQHQGIAHPDTLDSMGTLGNAYVQAGKLEQAVPLLVDALKLRKSKSGLQHPDTLHSMTELAAAYRHADKLDQALALLEETLKLSKAKPGRENLTLQILNELGLAYGQAQKPEQAATFAEEALKLGQAEWGSEHPETLALMGNLSAAYYASGRSDKAIALMEEITKLSEAKLGPEHPRTLLGMYSLAQGFWNAGRRDEAVPLYEKAFRGQKLKLGPDHSDTLITMRELAIAYRETGKIDEALQLFEELLKLNMATRGSDHSQTLLTAEGLAKAYREAGKLDELEAMYREQLTHPGAVPTAAFELGSVRLEAAKKNNADPGRSQDLAKSGQQLLREYLAGVRTRFTNEPAVLEIRIWSVAEAHYRQGNYAEAEPLYREILELRAGRLAADTPGVLDATASLARLLSNWAWAEHDSNRDKAAERAREAESLLLKVLAVRLRDSTNSWRIGDVKSRLGAALVSVAVTDRALDAEGRRTKFSEAESLLLKAHKRLRSSSAENKYKRDAIERLVRLYEVWNKPDNRVEWQQKLAQFDKAEAKSSAETQ